MGNAKTVVLRVTRLINFSQLKQRQFACDCAPRPQQERREPSDQGIAFERKFNLLQHSVIRRQASFTLNPFHGFPYEVENTCLPFVGFVQWVRTWTVGHRTGGRLRRRESTGHRRGHTAGCRTRTGGDGLRTCASVRVVNRRGCGCGSLSGVCPRGRRSHPTSTRPDCCASFR